VSDAEKSARIIETILAPTYSHAENIFRMFEDLAREHGTSEAIDLVYREVVEGDSVSTDKQ